MKYFSKILTTVLMISALFIACENGNDHPVDEPPTFDGLPEITFTSTNPVLVDLSTYAPKIKGNITCENGLKQVNFYKVAGTSKYLITSILKFNNSNDYDFKIDVDFAPSTSAVRVEAIDKYDQIISNDIRIKASFDPTFEAQEIGSLVSFPGAEGHGRYTTGGRGGRVLHVTSLKDDGAIGTLRWAINKTGARIIVFKVSGTIMLNTKLNIANGDITIAGQTAPGDGICIGNYPVSVSSNNVIIRFVRFRMGDASKQENDAIGGREIKDLIVDHCSMSWSTDECVSFYNNENTSLQWCIVSESLRYSVHNKGAHGYGGIWGGKNASFHHNLLAHHDSRNPRLGEIKGSAFALSDLVDLRNNVHYNWQGNSCYGGEAMNVNIVNCYYKPGPATTKESRIVAIDKLKTEGYAITNIWGKFYIDGNYMEGSEEATNDNWTYGVYNQFHSSNLPISDQEKMDLRIDTPHNPGVVTTHTAQDAYTLVMNYVGCSLKRDAVDERIINDVRSGTASFMTGGNGSVNGIIDTQSAVGGWPVLNTLPAPQDTDFDGMPDDWEIEKGLDPENPNDCRLNTLDSEFTNLCIYLASLAKPVML